jgi:hypothetical protein
LDETFSFVIRFQASVRSVTWHVTLLTLSNVALKMDPKVRAELLSRATTITQPDAMNSPEANQTSPIFVK